MAPCSAFANYSLDGGPVCMVPLFNIGNQWSRIMQNRTECRGRSQNLVRQNLRLARRWKLDGLGVIATDQLRDLTVKFGFSLALGDLAYLDRGWYITHAGLVRLASRRRCSGI